MSAATNHLEDAIGGHLFGDSTWSKPTTLYIALLTAVDDSETPTLTEVTGGGYDRVQRNTGSGNWQKNGNQWSNAGKVEFPAPDGADWGQITHAGLYDADADTGGNCLIVSALAESQTINDGDPAPFFAAGELVFSVD